MLQIPLSLEISGCLHQLPAALVLHKGLHIQPVCLLCIDPVDQHDRIVDDDAGKRQQAENGDEAEVRAGHDDQRRGAKQLDTRLREANFTTISPSSHAAIPAVAVTVRATAVAAVVRNFICLFLPDFFEITGERYLQRTLREVNRIKAQVSTIS